MSRTKLHRKGIQNHVMSWNNSQHDDITSEMAPDQYHNNELDRNGNCTEENEALLTNVNLLTVENKWVSGSTSTLSDVDTTTSGRDPNAKLYFNIGGTKFETLESTVEKAKHNNRKLINPFFLASRYDVVNKEYFFDRDPDVFRSVLNYWRTGHLHLPQTRCGPLLKEELDFWGLKEINISRCCWNSYHSWMQAHRSLDKMEHDMRGATQDDHTGKGSADFDGCGQQRLIMWNLLTEPSYSKAAKIYAYVALMFVILGIFSFCASTHVFFQQKDDSGNNDNNNNNITALATGAANSSMPLENEPDSNSTTTETPALKYLVVQGSRVHPALYYLDIACVIFFTVEYLLRLICAPKRFRFLYSFNSVVDILAIVPDYVEFILYACETDVTEHQSLMNFMPFLRLMRAFRIFRLIRRVPGLWIMFYTLKASFKELSLMLIFLLVGTLLFSSIIYFVDDPKVFSSIPQSFWWAIVTMTTVGYGDMSPNTALGQVVGSVTAICGVLIIGFTIPSLVNNFITYYNYVEFVMRKAKLLEEARKEAGRPKPTITSLIKNIQERKLDLSNDSEV